MFFSRYQKSLGERSWERFVTTYNSDYKDPYKQLQVNQLTSMAEIQPAPVVLSPVQTRCGIHYHYKTTNSTYGSAIWAQPLNCYHFPVCTSPMDIATPSSHPSLSQLTDVVSSILTEGGTQNVTVSEEDEKEEERAKMLEQKKEQHSRHYLYEEGMIVLSSLGCPACSADPLGSVWRQTALQHLLNFPVVSTLVTTNRDAVNWERPTPQIDSFLQPAPFQSGCCAEETERLKWRRSEPRRRSLLTEYQANFTARWRQPKVQLRV